jgi:hypothetical protein
MATGGETSNPVTADVIFMFVYGKPITIRGQTVMHIAMFSPENRFKRLNNAKESFSHGQLSAQANNRKVSVMDS